MSYFRNCFYQKVLYNISCFYLNLGITLHNIRITLGNKNVWQSLAYSPLCAIVALSSEYL